MRDVVVSFILIFAPVLLARAEDSRIPIEPISGTIAPYVSKDGYVNPIISLGEIDFGGGLTLPLVLNFSSEFRTASPEFGTGWECPLFDANIFDVQKDIKRVEMLGGKNIYLVQDSKTKLWRHYFTNNWKGQQNGADFELTYISGCKFVFHNGYIASLTMPNGRKIVWTRTSDSSTQTGSRLVSLGEDGKDPALELTYGNDGDIEQMVLNPHELGRSRQEYDFKEDANSELDKIECPRGRVIALTHLQDNQGNPTLKLADSNALPITLSWDGKTGRILSDDNYTYNFEEVNEDKGWPKMFRMNKATGNKESYYFDVKTGNTQWLLPNGTLRVIEMNQSPGPNYKMVKLIQDTRNGKTTVMLRRAFDDQGHLVLEALMMGNGKEQTRQYAYDEVGRVVSFTFNGKEIWKNVYDPITGQLKEHDVTNLGVSMVFQTLPNGQVKESIEKGQNNVVVSTQTLGAQAWQAVNTSLQQTN